MGSSTGRFKLDLYKAEGAGDCGTWVASICDKPSIGCKDSSECITCQKRNVMRLLGTIRTIQQAYNTYNSTTMCVTCFSEQRNLTTFRSTLTGFPLNPDTIVALHVNPFLLGVFHVGAHVTLPYFVVYKCFMCSLISSLAAS